MSKRGARKRSATELGRGPIPGRESILGKRGPRFGLGIPLERFRLSSWQILAFILMGSFILQASTLTVPFFADDYVFLDFVRFKSLWQSVLSPDPLNNYFRPLGRQVYFWLNAHISNESPVFFHSVNLSLFFLSLGLLFSIGKRMASMAAGAVAAGFLALHYAVDLPLRWASGSQDLLATAGALVAIRLFLARRQWLAAPVLFLALLCKEVVVFTPLIAILLGRWEGESWKRAAYRTLPLFLVLIPWAIMWHLFGSQIVAPGLRLTFGVSGFLASLVQLARVIFGFEWPTGQFVSRWLVVPPILALLPVVIAVLLASSPRRQATQPRESEHAPKSPRSTKVAHSPASGLGWALLGAIPVGPVATIWCSYHFLFALAGIGLALGMWVTRLPRWVAVALIVIVAWTSQGARLMDEFATAPNAWSAQSHLNSWWFNRGAGYVKSYLRDLKQAHSTVPRGSTFFFSGIPGFTIWHSAPLVHWAYRDSSLNGYLLGEFSLERAGRGPDFYFIGHGNRLEEIPASDALQEVASAMLRRGDLNKTREALILQLETDPGNQKARYWLGWVEWALGDTARALDMLKQTGLVLDRGPSPEFSYASTVASSGETQRAIDLVFAAVRRHGLDPAGHALLSDLLYVRESRTYKPSPDLFIEAFAARALEPQNPAAWKRWGILQYYSGLFAEAGKSLNTYLELAGPAADGDAQVREMLDKIPRLLPGGDLVQQAVRRERPE